MWVIFQFGTQFYEKVYNETVNIVEVEEGLDGETFFLYVFLGAGVLLLLVISQQFLYSVGKKRVGGAGKKQNPQLETGTTKKNDIDYDWVPPHLLKSYGSKFRNCLNYWLNTFNRYHYALEYSFFIDLFLYR